MLIACPYNTFLVILMVNRDRTGGSQPLSREAVIVRAGRELMDNHQVSQETFDAALARFGNANTIVLGALMGYYSFIACTLLPTDMRPAEGSPILPNRL